MAKRNKGLDKKVAAVNMVPKPSHNYITLRTNLGNNLAQNRLKSSRIKSYNQRPREEVMGKDRADKELPRQGKMKEFITAKSDKKRERFFFKEKQKQRHDPGSLTSFSCEPGKCISLSFFASLSSEIKYQ